MVGLVSFCVSCACQLLLCPFTLFFLLRLSDLTVCIGSNSSEVLGFKAITLVSLKELCRMESKTGSRNGEHQQGHGRLAALPNGGLSTSVPTLKNTGMMEPLYRSNQKYVQFSCSCFYEIMGDLCHLLSNSSSC